MIDRFGKAWIAVYLILGLALSAQVWTAPGDEEPAETAAPKSKIVPTNVASDVRIVIDISGSMRQNDPENLRIPALNLIVELLPEGSQAGVWTFGQWVNMLVPPEKVDDKWRENAKLKAKTINSHGLRTNIGEAMEKATWKFEKNGQFEQHVILLTDGLVDIAADKDPAKAQINEAERRRIMTDVLKQYQDLGVKVHTIALSENADKILLEKLSLTTNGMNEVVNNSEQLVKAFLKAFEKAAPVAAEQVPLAEDNTFEIDESVQEFTALVFRKKGSAPTQLTSPDGKILSQIKASENARWFSESVYDLVTIEQPQAGTWKIIADLDPDNRVTVVSDLKMEITNLPSSLFPGQQVNFEVYLHEEGEILTNQDFLRLMTVEMKMTAESGRSGTKQINDPENIPADGRFRESIKRLNKEGQYELQITVDGKTFQRMRKEYIQVRQPIGFEIRKQIHNGEMAYAVRVIPQVPDIEVARTRVIAKLKGPDQHSIIQAVPWIEEGVWESIIMPDKGPGTYEMALNVKGRFGVDQEFRIKPDPIVLVFPIPEDFTHEYFVKEDIALETTDPLQVWPEALDDSMGEVPPEAQDPSKEPVEEPIVDPIEEPAIEDMASAETELEDVSLENETIPFWLYILIPVLTLVLGLAGFFIVRKLSKKKAAALNDDKPTTKQDSGMSAPEPAVSLNDGMDDEEFDEDFDLSDDDDDDDDLDGMDDLDLAGDDEPEESESVLEDADEEDLAQDVEDDIPDFDENFDIDADVEPEESITATNDDEASAAIDELDSVLDSLTDDEAIEEDIPKLDDEVLEEPDESAPEVELDALEDEENDDFNLDDDDDDDDDFNLDDDSFNLDDDQPSESEDVLSEPEPEPEAQVDPEEEANNGEAAIDEALANLESELDDIDVDALVDDAPTKDE
mgnify:CR=1 FL=1